MSLDRRAFLHLSAGLLAGGAGLPLAARAQASAANATPVNGGTLTYAVQQEPPGLVSLLDTNTVIRNISAKISEGLLRYDAQFRPQPLLAVRWSVSDDGLHYTFALRPNVRWHDGQPFTSNDVRFSVLTQKRLGPRGRITLANVARVDTPDALTAVIVLDKPTPYLLKALAPAELPSTPS